MEVQKTIPILRIFNYNKAIEFYIDWLGFEIEWKNIAENKCDRPGLEEALYGAWCVTLNDPFYNKISFNEKK